MLKGKEFLQQPRDYYLLQLWCQLSSYYTCTHNFTCQLKWFISNEIQMEKQMQILQLQKETWHLKCFI